MVPLRPITREQLMRDLCGVHARRGPDYEVGLGFYAFLRFHVDTTKFRRWNMDPAVADAVPADRPSRGYRHGRQPLPAGHSQRRSPAARLRRAGTVAQPPPTDRRPKVILAAPDYRGPRSPVPAD